MEKYGAVSGGRGGGGGGDRPSLVILHNSYKSANIFPLLLPYLLLLCLYKFHSSFVFIAANTSLQHATA